jgi:hypothetical protein
MLLSCSLVHNVSVKRQNLALHKVDPVTWGNQNCLCDTLTAYPKAFWIANAHLRTSEVISKIF